jgi:hypothetical protein
LIFFGGFVFLFTKEEIEGSGILESCKRERERNGKEMHGENPFHFHLLIHQSSLWVSLDATSKIKNLLNE